MKLRYWCKQSLMPLGSFLLASIIFGLLQAMTAGSLRAVADETLMFGALFGCLFQGIFVMALYQFQLPLVLSFGSTRREAHVHMKVFQLLVVLGALVLYYLLALVPHDLPAFSPLLLLGAYLLFSAMGSLTGILSSRYGKVAGLAFNILFALSCLGLGFFFGFDGALSIGDLFRSSGPLTWLLLGAGVLAQVLMVLPERRTINTLVVKL